jgi:hypothetical protein
MFITVAPKADCCGNFWIGRKGPIEVCLMLPLLTARHALEKVVIHISCGRMGAEI